MDNKNYDMLNLQAVRLLTRHDHESKGTGMERANCGACALNGYGDKAYAVIAPNYSGWARVYVQAGKTIPKKYADAFLLDELGSDNSAYANELVDDIKYYGLKIA